jgi:predicted PurR-regulated permease PerM
MSEFAKLRDNSAATRQEFENPNREFVRRTLTVVGIVATVVVALGIALLTADVFLLIFGGILLATLLRGFSDPLSKCTGLPAGWALTFVVLIVAAIIAVGAWLIAAQVVTQFDQLTQFLPKSWAKLQEYVGSNAWGRKLLKSGSSANELLLGRADILARVSSIFSTALGMITTLVIVLFVGGYLAADPAMYRKGLVQLIPIDKRTRAHEVLDAVGRTLRWWLIGRLISMILVSLATVLGLWLLGIPAAMALGCITFLLVFIPYIGPIVAAVPAVLLALSSSEPLAPLYVALLYLGIQILEGYLLTPMIQSHTVNMPPVITLVAQVFLGVLLGVPGIVLATPLAAVAIVLVKRVYVEDVLGDSGNAHIPVPTRAVRESRT